MSYRSSPFWRAYDALAQAVDRRFGWDRLPTPLGIPVLIGLRNILRKRNLYDTTGQPSVNPPPVPPRDDRLVAFRSLDGTHNDLDSPSMGMAGSRFGRNVPLERTFPEAEPRLMSPNPREVSRRLMTREEFQPAIGANALVAPWLQFMIKDWFSHGRSPTDNPWQVQVEEDDSWPGPRPMSIMRTRPDPTRPEDPGALPPTWANTETHWWDGSQLYGTNQAHQDMVRSRKEGKLRVSPEGLIPYSMQPDRNPFLMPGFWLGLAMLQTLFTLEHNSICDHLRAAYPSWSDDELFERARLVNSALLAKIHTVEWTPAVISHPTTKAALRANWWGLAGERVHQLVGRLSSSEVISGIPGSETQHFDVPYSLTEEFVAVYRMHPLVPDHFDFRSVSDDSPIRQVTFRDISGPGALDVMHEVSMTDLMYSFGTEPPGLVTLHNFPKFLQEFQRPDGTLQDMAATDILRSRELGVPRYNEFRRLLHLPPARDFHSLTEDPQWAEEIRRVYNDDIESVDLTVGMYAEPLPPGFAFSDTAFRIFVLMASRRLNSDRFFTKDYRPEVYSQAGLDWIDDNSMATVLQRHHPRLRHAMDSIDNAFLEWKRP